MSMKIEHIVQALQEAAVQLGLEVRWEKGGFRGGRCRVGDREVIVLNKRHPPEVHVSILSESLEGLPVDTIFLRPAVREAMEYAWERHAESLTDDLLDDAE